ncbi:MAG: biotin--[acetyl-CoA-carboxylase] ligase [Dehalococcoidia bacterium]
MDWAPFDAARYQRDLATRAIGRFLVYRTETDTTMVLARREADEGAPHGTLVLAEAQTAGRGRRGRSFHSPAGENLYFTMVLRLPEGQHRRLPIVVPLAVARACAAEGVDARIKWPNDIWIGERKTCGMLIDAEVTPGGAVAFPGIGINVNGDPTVIPELREIATSLARERGRPVDREALLARICNELEWLLRRDDQSLAAAYRGMSMILGREVVVEPGGNEPAYRGHAEEIEPDGSLRVRLADGAANVVRAADVTVRPSGEGGAAG